MLNHEKVYIHKWTINAKNVRVIKKISYVRLGCVFFLNCKKWHVIFNWNTFVFTISYNDGED